MPTLPWTCEAVCAQLEALGSEGARRIFGSQGAGENQYGVPLGKLRALAKKVKVHHPLALELWATGNTDARLLATLIMAPGQLSRKEAESMVHAITYFRLIDELVENVLVREPYAPQLRDRWLGASQEFVGRAGWMLLICQLSAGEREGVDLDEILVRIESGILSAPLRKQETMNRCLVEIGVRFPDYTARCLALGERLGRFDRRPVPKGCTAPYAPEWIAAVLRKRR